MSTAVAAYLAITCAYLLGVIIITAFVAGGTR